MFRNKYFLLVLALSIIPLFDLLHPGLPITHDGQDHVARIANFYRNLQDGVLIPRWAPNLNWGYGHPVLMFLYPFSSYITSIFHLLGFSFVDSMKIFFGLAFIASGISMYLWIREVYGEKEGIVAAILYIYAPYRFIDLYVRGAIGEHAAFIFPPLVMLALYKLSKKYSAWWIVWGSVFLSGAILAHNAISLMFLPVFGLYFLYLFQGTRNKKTYSFSVAAIFVLGFGLSAFFWLPAFFEGKYTLRDIVTAGEYSSRFVKPLDFLYGPWSYGGSGLFTVQLGIAQWIVVVLSFIGLLTFKKQKDRVFLAGTFVILVSTLFLMTEYAGLVWKIITTLQKFQFPWRFLSISVFVISVLGAIVVNNCRGKYRDILVCVLIAVALFLTRDYWRAHEYQVKPESFYADIYDGTTDTGESAPIWSVRFMEKRPQAHLQVIDGNDVQIKEQQRKSVSHIYSVKSSSRVRLRENTLYFPGWHVLVDGVEAPVEFQDQQNRGLITFFIEKGDHVVSIIFKETRLRLLADALSVFSLVILLVYCILRARLWRLFP